MTNERIKLSKKRKYILFFLLIVLNVILRYPTVPHEIGWDSFVEHALANSISTFGYAEWATSLYGIIGQYPNSEVSAVPFLLSGISQATNLEMELAILAYSFFIGISGIFFAYIMAGAIIDDDIFKFLVAFAFSTSQGILTYSTWTGVTRTLFVILLPVFVYILVKSYRSKIKFGFLVLLFLILLLATHQMTYFTLPVIISFFLTKLYISFKKGSMKRLPVIVKGVSTGNFFNILLLTSFIIMLLLPFFNRELMEAVPRGYGGSRYGYIISALIPSYIRYTGILLIFVIPGLIFLLLKQKNNFEELFLSIAIIGLTPLIYLANYMKWFMPAFFSILIGISLTNVFLAHKNSNSQFIKGIVVVVLIVSTAFSGYYQFLHFLNDDIKPDNRYMDDSVYHSATWSKSNIDKTKHMAANSGLTATRVLATSQIPTFVGGTPDLAYGFINRSEINITKNSFLSISFFKYGAYVRSNATPALSFYFDRLNLDPIDDYHVKDSINKFKFSYFISNNDMATRLSQSLRTSDKNIIYTNGKISIWSFN